MRTLISVLLFCAAPLSAAPVVVASIPPVAGVAAGLMEGVGTPVTLLPPGAEPHEFALRPSHLTALGEADLVLVVGLEMEPWLDRIKKTSSTLPLFELGPLNTAPLPARSFGDLDRAAQDPHMWTDPNLVRLWAEAIAAQLTEQDPENADIYHQNLASFIGQINEAETSLHTLGARLQDAGIQLVVTHDAFQYLEAALGLQNAGMLTDAYEQRAGARTLAALHRVEGPVCIIEVPEIIAPDGLLPDAPRVMIDPMGADYAGETDFTLRFFQSVETALEGCFQQP